MCAEGKTTITVQKELYKRIKEIASSKKLTVAELIEEAFSVYEKEERPRLYIDSILRTLDISPDHSFRWPAGFPATLPYDPYYMILMDPKVREYFSTAWIRSKEYIKNVGYPQFRPLGRTLLGELKVQKILILPENALTNENVREWVQRWIVVKNIFDDLKVTLGEMFHLFIVWEKKARAEGIHEKYYDMGIYGDLVVGYLELSEKSDALSYTWVNREEEKKAAREAFKKLIDCAVKPEEYPFFKLG